MLKELAEAYFGLLRQRVLEGRELTDQEIDGALKLAQATVTLPPDLETRLKSIEQALDLVKGLRRFGSKLA